jgi:hypothetical protein
MEDTKMQKIPMFTGLGTPKSKLSTIKIQQDGDVFTSLSHVNSKPENRKIGDVCQTWHLTVQKPSEAYTSGNDSKVCFDCPFRSKASGGNGGCYVVTIHGPNGVHSSHRTKPENRPVNQDVQPLPDKINKPIRFGAYGDPVVMPVELMRDLASRATGHLGYTHQWLTCDPAYSEFLMASIDEATAKQNGMTVTELADKAKSMGWRTFRVKSPGDLNMVDEITCPNTTKGVQCADCGLCAGNTISAKSITIDAHGTGAANIAE